MRLYGGEFNIVPTAALVIRAGIAEKVVLSSNRHQHFVVVVMYIPLLQLFRLRTDCTNERTVITRSNHHSQIVRLLHVEEIHRDA
jgi:hypothetical protein